MAFTLPHAELVKHRVMLRSGSTRRRPAGKTKRPRPIIGLVSTRDRPAELAGRRVPGRWEGDPTIGKNSTTAVATLGERTTLFTIMLAVPTRRTSLGVVDAIIEYANSVPTIMRRSITRDRGPEWAAHATLTLTIDTRPYFAYPRARRAWGLNENTTGLTRGYLITGDTIPGHQPFPPRHCQKKPTNNPLPHP